MDKLNLPPFYVGQKVVRLAPHADNKVIKGNIYTVLGLKKNHCKCAVWHIDVGVIDYDTGYSHETCTGCGVVRKFGRTWWFTTNNWAPAQQAKLPLIKLSEILKHEKEEVLSEN